MVRARRLTSLSIALVASCLLVACGGDDDDTSATTVATTAAAPETTEAEPATTASSPTTVAATDAPETTGPETSAPETTSPETTAASVGSIVDVAQEAGSFSTLLSIVDAAGLTDSVATGKVTLLAPTDDAFVALGQPAIDALLADPAAATALVQNHLLPLPQDLHTIGLFGNVVTSAGGSLPVTNDGTVVTIGGATVVTPDVAADNGIIQVIDAVLVPAAA
jgi:uncharacterized surface protein with fasciclin (FAS1) repeats